MAFWKHIWYIQYFHRIPFLLIFEIKQFLPIILLQVYYGCKLYNIYMKKTQEKKWKKWRKIYMLNNAFLCYTEISIYIIYVCILIYIQEICYECLNIYYRETPGGWSAFTWIYIFIEEIMQYGFARQTNCVQRSRCTHTRRTRPSIICIFVLTIH